ncbi:MAG TPA: helix-turn-helix domain-containing protein [Methanocella sp.]|jgi:DNA-binding HxlR family transcriptional regulator
MTLKKKYHCPVEAAIDLIGGKWKPLILWALRDGTLRFSQIESELHGITQKMLTKQLRELEQDGLVARKVYAQVPPKVEYTLTPTGVSLIPVLDMLCEWGSEHMGSMIEFACNGKQ